MIKVKVTLNNSVIYRVKSATLKEINNNNLYYVFESNDAYKVIGVKRDSYTVSYNGDTYPIPKHSEHLSQGKEYMIPFEYIPNNITIEPA